MSWKQPIDTSLEDEFGDDKQAYILFILLLVKANNTTRQLGIGRKLITVERGQVLFGRKMFAEYFGWSEKKPERVLQRLCDVQKVTKKVTKNGTVVTICRYDDLVAISDQVNDQVMTKKRPSSDQVVTTNKSVENDNNERVKELPSYGSLEKITDHVCQDIADELQVNLSPVLGIREELKDYCQGNGKRYKDYKATLRNWTRRRIDEGKIKKLSPSYQQSQQLPEVEIATEAVRNERLDIIRKQLASKLSI